MSYPYLCWVAIVVVVGRRGLRSGGGIAGGRRSVRPGGALAGRSCDALDMSVVKINAVTVPEGMGEDFMERFAKRAGSVESQPGFEEFLLLKPSDGGDRFFVFTRWESEEAFEGWMSSRDFAAAHNTDAQGDAPPQRPAGPPGVTAELLAFDVVERVTAG